MAEDISIPDPKDPRFGIIEPKVFD
jgi:hypothetical protein